MKKQSYIPATIMITVITLSALLMNITKFFLRLYIFPVMLIVFPLVFDRSFSYSTDIIKPGKRGLKLFLSISVLVLVFYPFLFFLYWQGFIGRTIVQPGYREVSEALYTGMIAFLVAAVPEEFFFRGYLQEHVLKKFNKKILKIITLKNLMTSALFGALHAVALLNIAGAATFFPSLLFGLFTEKSGGRIFYSIAFHTLSNVLAFILWTFIR